MNIDTLLLVAGAVGITYLVMRKRTPDSATAPATASAPTAQPPVVVVVDADQSPGYMYPAWGGGVFGGGGRHHHHHHRRH